MKEVELTGTIEEVYEKLKAHVGQRICQYNNEDKFECILTEVKQVHSGCIRINTDLYGEYSYLHGVAPPFFLCIEEDEVLETFDEMVRRKQQEIFRSLK